MNALLWMVWVICLFCGPVGWIIALGIGVYLWSRGSDGHNIQPWQQATFTCTKCGGVVVQNDAHCSTCGVKLIWKDLV